MSSRFLQRPRIFVATHGAKRHYIRYDADEDADLNPLSAAGGQYPLDGDVSEIYHQLQQYVDYGTHSLTERSSKLAHYQRCLKPLRAFSVFLRHLPDFDHYNPFAHVSTVSENTASRRKLVRTN